MSSAEDQPRGTGENNENEGQAQPRRRRRGWIVGGIIAGGLFMLVAACVSLILLVGLAGSDGGGTVSAPETYEEDYVFGEGDQKIAVVPVEGVISPADSGLAGTVPATTPDGLRDALQQAEDSEDVAAVILEINSPGGGVTASDQMYNLINDFKESSDKPVVASMGSVAASGGYYIATAADEIVANATTTTGSLGVVLPLNDFTGLKETVGVDRRFITSGEFKTIGSPWTNLSQEERGILRSYVDDSFEQFVQVIVEGRGLSEERVREVADGRIYTGSQAKELNLVDELGDLDKAAEVSRQRADIDEATVVRYVQPPGFVDFLQARLGSSQSETGQLMEAANLDLEGLPYYLYLPGR
ncbi:MAG: signal peptide peptidase SppA [Rubrobacteraceae bacterium]